MAGWHFEEIPLLLTSCSLQIGLFFFLVPFALRDRLPFFQNDYELDRACMNRDFCTVFYLN